MERALEHPRLRKAENICLDVWDQNAKALGLYKSYGAEVIGKWDLMVDSPVVEDDLVMVRWAGAWPTHRHRTAPNRRRAASPSLSGDDRPAAGCAPIRRPPA
jgi:hypothetical protein